MVRPAHRAAALLLPLLLSSCFTLTLWGFELESETDPFTGRTEEEFTYDKDTEWSWGLLGLRLLGTPFALALDCLTAPVQAWVFWDDDDDDC